MHIKLLFVFAAFALSATDDATAADSDVCENSKVDCTLRVNCLKPGILEVGCLDDTQEDGQAPIGAIQWHRECCRYCIEGRTVGGTVDAAEYIQHLKVDFANAGLPGKCFVVNGK